MQLARTQQKIQENHKALTGEDTEVTKSKMCKRLQKAMFGQGKDVIFIYRKEWQIFEESKTHCT